MNRRTLQYSDVSSLQRELIEHWHVTRRSILLSTFGIPSQYLRFLCYPYQPAEISAAFSCILCPLKSSVLLPICRVASQAIAHPCQSWPCQSMGAMIEYISHVCLPRQREKLLSGQMWAYISIQPGESRRPGLDADGRFVLPDGTVPNALLPSPHCTMQVLQSEPSTVTISRSICRPLSAGCSRR
jgi:hypothetical protein